MHATLNGVTRTYTYLAIFCCKFVTKLASFLLVCFVFIILLSCRGESSLHVSFGFVCSVLLITFFRLIYTLYGARACAYDVCSSLDQVMSNMCVQDVCLHRMPNGSQHALDWKAKAG